MVAGALWTCWGQEFTCCLMSSTMVIEKKYHRWQALHSSRLPTLWTALTVHQASNAKCTRLLPWRQSSLRMAITTTSTRCQSSRKNSAIPPQHDQDPQWPVAPTLIPLYLPVIRLPAESCDPHLVSWHCSSHLLPTVWIPQNNVPIFTARRYVLAVRWPSKAQHPVFVTCITK